MDCPGPEAWTQIHRPSPPGRCFHMAVELVLLQMLSCRFFPDGSASISSVLRTLSSVVLWKLQAPCCFTLESSSFLFLSCGWHRGLLEPWSGSGDSCEPAPLIPLNLCWCFLKSWISLLCSFWLASAGRHLQGRETSELNWTVSNYRQFVRLWTDEDQKSRRRLCKNPLFFILTLLRSEGYFTKVELRNPGWWQNGGWIWSGQLSSAHPDQASCKE